MRIFLQEINLPNSALDIIDEAFVIVQMLSVYNTVRLHACLEMGRRQEGFQILNEALLSDNEKSDMLYEFLPTLKEDTEVALAVAAYRS